MTKGEKQKTKYHPFVSICTPTFNRRPFIASMIQCFKNQTYPKNRLEWIIVDDGTDCVRDLIEAAKIEQIRYFREEKKMPLGEKRNYMHSKIKGSIVVYMDDDDYYPPERVSHAVEMLQTHPHALCAGASEIYVYFKHIQQMYQAGPYGPNHATAGTFAFRAELLKDSRYEDHAALAEEKHFLKNYTVPFVQLDPLKTILVFSHEHNTFDKRRLLETPNEYFKTSNKTVDHFIRKSSEASIKQFFMTDIDGLLAKYASGEPSMKPDVLKQIKEIEEERRKMIIQHQHQQQNKQQQEEQVGSFMLNEPGKPPRPMSQQEIAEHMNNSIQEINGLRQKNESLEVMVANLQKRIAQSNDTAPQVTTPTPTPTTINPSNQTTFMTTLLTRITELEKKNKSLEQQLQDVNKIKAVESIKVVEIPKVFESSIPKEIIMKSKSMPEVIVEL